MEDSGTIFESLPPQVADKVRGRLILRLRSVSLSDKKEPINFKIKYEWWGHLGAPITMSVPWKKDASPEDAVFPLRAERAEIQQYLTEMKVLKIEVLDDSNGRYGKAQFQLDKLFDEDNSSAPVNVVLPIQPSKSGGGKHRNKAVDLGNINVSFMMVFEGEEAVGYNPTFSSPEMMQGFEQYQRNKEVANSAKQVDESPIRPGSQSSHHPPSGKTGINSFQMNEAKVFTDNSNKLPEWPADAGGHTNMDVAVVMGGSNNNTKSLVEEESISVVQRSPDSLPQPVQKQTLESSDTHITASSVSDSKDGENDNNYAVKEVADQKPPVAAAPGSSSKKIKRSSPSVAAREGKKADAKSLQEKEAAEEKPILRTGVEDLLSKAESLLSMVTSAVSKPKLEAKSSSPGKGDRVGGSAKKSGKGRGSKQDSPARSTNKPGPRIVNTSGPITMGTIGLPPKGSLLAGKPGERMFTLPTASDPEAKENMLQLLEKTRTIIRSADPKFEMNQIEMLMNGVPEAYGEEEITDEEINAILNEGGPPPSCLVYPSLYAANQRAMNRLVNMRKLHIKLDHLLVYSARYGIRKEHTHILVHPPSGVPVDTEGHKYDTAATYVPIPELCRDLNVISFGDEPDKQATSNHNVVKKAQKGILKDHFVGGMDIHKEVEFDLDLKDSVLREWIRGKGHGCLRIEVHSYVQNPDAGKDVDSSVFGWVEIPMGGLLGTDALDVAVTAEIVVNGENLASVINRMRQMPYGHQLVRAKKLGDKMGSISARISLRPDATTIEKELGLDRDAGLAPVMHEEYDREQYGLPPNTVSKSKLAGSRLAYTHPDVKTNEAMQRPGAQPLMVPQASEEVLAMREKEIEHKPDAVVEALNFVPEEAPRKVPMGVPAWRSPEEIRVEQEAAARGDPAGDHGHSPVPIFVGVCLYSVFEVTLPYAVEAPVITVCYRISKNDLVQAGRINLMRLMEEEDTVNSSGVKYTGSFDTSSGVSSKLYEHPNMREWEAPVFEIWLERDDASKKSSSRDALDSGYFLSEPAQKYLLGLARFQANDAIGDVMELRVENTITNETIGCIEASVHFDEKRACVEELMNRKVSNYFDQKKSLAVSQSDALAAMEKKRSWKWETTGTRMHRYDQQKEEEDAESIASSLPPRKIIRGHGIVELLERQRREGEADAAWVNENVPGRGIEVMSIDSLSSVLADSKATAEAQGKSRQDVSTEEDKLLKDLFYKDGPPVDDGAGAKDTNDTADEKGYGSKDVDVKERGDKVLRASFEDADLRETKTDTVLSLPSQSETSPTAPAPVHTVKQTATRRSRAGIEDHVLDLGIHGTCCGLDESSSAGHDNSLFNCLVVFVFPTQSDVEGPSTLWWDGEFPVLNARQRFEFRSAGGSDDDLFSGDIEMQIYLSNDTEASINAINESHLLGRAVMKAASLNKIVEQAGCSTTLNLAVHKADSAEPVVASVIQRLSTSMQVQVSHRIQPALLRQGRDEAVTVPSVVSDDTAAIPKSNDGNEAGEVVPMPNHLPLYVQIQEMMHLPEDLLVSHAQEPVQLVGSVYAIGSQNVNQEPDMNPYIPGYGSFVSKGRGIGVDSARVVWNNDGVVYMDCEDKDIKKLRNSTLLASVYSRKVWRTLLGSEDNSIEDGESTSINRDVHQLRIGDQLVGSAGIDLSALSFGMPSVEGWYHIYNKKQEQVRSQIKITVRIATEEEEQQYAIPLPTQPNVTASTSSNALRRSYNINLLPDLGALSHLQQQSAPSTTRAVEVSRVRSSAEVRDSLETSKMELQSQLDNLVIDESAFSLEYQYQHTQHGHLDQDSNDMGSDAVKDSSVNTSHTSGSGSLVPTPEITRDYSYSNSDDVYIQEEDVQTAQIVRGGVDHESVAQAHDADKDSLRIVTGTTTSSATTVDDYHTPSKVQSGAGRSRATTFMTEVEEEDSTVISDAHSTLHLEIMENHEHRGGLRPGAPEFLPPSMKEETGDVDPTLDRAIGLAFDLLNAGVDGSQLSADSSAGGNEAVSVPNPVSPSVIVDVTSGDIIEESSDLSEDYSEDNEEEEGGEVEDIGAAGEGFRDDSRSASPGEDVASLIELEQLDEDDSEGSDVHADAAQNTSHASSASVQSQSLNAASDDSKIEEEEENALELSEMVYFSDENSEGGEDDGGVFDGSVEHDLSQQGQVVDIAGLAAVVAAEVSSSAESDSNSDEQYDDNEEKSVDDDAHFSTTLPVDDSYNYHEGTGMDTGDNADDERDFAADDTDTDDQGYISRASYSSTLLSYTGAITSVTDEQASSDEKVESTDSSPSCVRPGGLAMPTTESPLKLREAAAIAMARMSPQTLPLVREDGETSDSQQDVSGEYESEEGYDEEELLVMDDSRESAASAEDGEDECNQHEVRSVPVPPASTRVESFEFRRPFKETNVSTVAAGNESMVDASYDESEQSNLSALQIPGEEVGMLSQTGARGMDTPGTAKIRRVVQEEVYKVLEREGYAHEEEEGANEKVSADDTTHERVLSSELPSVAIEKEQVKKKPSEMSESEKIALRVSRALDEASAIQKKSMKKKGKKSKASAQQKQFLDAEIDRVSKIMMQGRK